MGFVLNKNKKKEKKSSNSSNYTCIPYVVWPTALRIIL